MKHAIGAAVSSAVLYAGPIRAGRPGSLTQEKYRVVQNARTGLAYLEPRPVVNYHTSEYRLSYDGADSADAYLERHHDEQPPYLRWIEPRISPRARVLDCGCGGGALLDLLKPRVAYTCGVEPFTGYHDSLRSRGHVVYGSVSDAQRERGQMDLVTSIAVIEHVSNPIAHLRDIRRLLKPGGYLVLATPNLNDILLELAPSAYQPFWYRTAHLYYFNADSLTWAAREAGFRDLEVFYHQEYGLNNAVGWIRDGVPRGHEGASAIEPDTDRAWRASLERAGRSTSVGLIGKA